MRRILAVLLCLCMIFCFAGCGEEKKGTTTTQIPVNDSTDAYADEDYGFQLEAPEEGEEIAVLHTSMGDIYMRFFEKAAPKAVENFKTHVKNGYYNGLTFHRVISDFMIQGGDPKGDGTGGESIWDDYFEDEFDKKLVNITGAVAMANSGTDTNGSQFFINNPGTSATKEQFGSWEEMKEYYLNSAEEYKAQYKESYGSTYPNWEQMFITSFYKTNQAPVYESIPDEIWELYYENGANFHLDGAYKMSGGHTVFAHVYSGMDIVDQICGVETDENNNKPTTDVVITSAEITTYNK